MIIDTKTALHFRQVALNMAQSTHDGAHPTPEQILTTARSYYNFMAGNLMSALPAAMLPTASGLPDDEAPLPTDTICSAYASEADTSHLRDLRRKLLHELDAVSNELKLRGVQPN